MRKVIVWVAWGIALGAVACGPSKPPEDASSSAANTKKDDGTENVKWEGASKDDMEAHKAGPPAGSQTTPSVKENRHDQYDKEGTEVVLKRAARQVKANCGHAKDDNGKASGPWGKTNVSIQLGHNGRGKGATVPAPFDGKPTGKCAVQAFANLTFPPWSGDDTTVEWEVEIVEPGKEGK
jgi:hypothetical protein